MRLISVGLVGLALALAPVQGAAAQEWPTRPVTFVVPFPAGAAVDTLARAVANSLSEKLGKQFIVENRTGAGGNIGGSAVAKAGPDGYTFLFGTPAPIAINKLMYKGLNYDSEKDFIAGHSRRQVAAHHRRKSQFPRKDIRGNDRICQSRIRERSTSAIRAMARSATSPRNWCSKLPGVKMTNVPYRGSAPLMTDLMAGKSTSRWISCRPMCRR